MATSDDNATKIITFLGEACSSVSEPTAALTGRLYRVVQVRILHAHNLSRIHIVHSFTNALKCTATGSSLQEGSDKTGIQNRNTRTFFQHFTNVFFL